MNSSYGHNNNTNARLEEERLQALLDEDKQSSQDRQRLLLEKQQEADRKNQEIQREIDRATAELEVDRKEILGRIDDKEKEHTDARTHCKDALAAMGKKSGRTAAETEALIDEVATTPRSAIIRKIGLPGGSLNVKAIRIIKWILTVASVLISGFSIGIVTRLLTPKHIFDRLDGIALSLVFGAAVSLGLWLLSAQGWAICGQRVTSRRDCRSLMVALAALTLLLLLSFAYLDGHALYVINATRSSFNPELKMDQATSLLCGLVMSGLYIGGLSLSGYSEGYNSGIEEAVQAEQHAEKQRLLDDPVRKVLVRKAHLANNHLQGIEDDLKTLNSRLQERMQAFKALRSELQASFKERPDSLPEDEYQRSRREKIRQQEEIWKAEL